MSPTGILALAARSALAAPSSFDHKTHTVSTEIFNRLDTLHIVRELLIAGLTVSTLSLLMTSFTLYWFIRIRRTFRQELIWLLIQSDFLKSLVFVIFPIISFTRGAIPTRSAYCQVSGFLLAMGMQSSDIAVFCIALHSLMYILRPRSGLYPYRHIAYLVYYLLPVTTASLSFINGHGYENLGGYCYYRTDQRWSRLALSWGPRYFVCISVICMYTFIYIYVRWGMGEFGRERAEALNANSPPGTRKHSGFRSASMPRLSYHGLIPSTSCSRRTSLDTMPAPKQQRQPGNLPSTNAESEPTPVAGAVNFGNWLGFASVQRLKDTLGGGPARGSVDSSRDPAAPPSPAPMPLLVQPAAAHLPQPRVPSPETPSPDPTPESGALSSGRCVSFQLAQSSVEDATEPGRPRFLSLPGTLTAPTPAQRPSPSPPNGDAPLTTATTSTSVDPSNFDLYFNFTSDEDQDPDQPRHKAQRQLRSLFIYPLVYILIWIFPFVAHILRYDDVSQHENHGTPTYPYYDDIYKTAQPYFVRVPRWLLVLGLVTFGIQGAVDSAVFLWRETPWKHAEDRGVLEGLRKRWSWRWKRFVSLAKLIGVALRIPGVRADDPSLGSWWRGRTREEVLADRKLARERRAAEEAAERERERQREREREERRRRQEERERERMDAEAAEARVDAEAAEAAEARTGSGSVKGRREWWDSYEDEEVGVGGGGGGSGNRRR
ncbi:hypothetical protein VTJ04DRAFT_5101 [Mycothermus thermophilus]|uniref:uncharacterized protein n=1 Tax=Humicola insolens TaxID=85995 RepID=UPI003743ABFB